MKTMTTLISFCLLVCNPVQAEIYSYLFKDVISNGNGNINLLSPRNNKLEVNGALLEQFRLDNNGALVFAVDVNEASDGSENADSQGLAIKRAELTLSFGAETEVLTVFSTRTQVLLQEKGTTEPQLFHSLIGVGGSSLISPHIKSELTGTSIDSTIRFAIDRVLTDVTAASLVVELLDTEVSLGDPEAFYDFSNGFEEIALLTAADVAYLESLERGIAFAPMVILDGESQTTIWSYYPSSDTYYVAAFEDLFPAKGDYDFNDLVVAYQLKVGSNSQQQVKFIRGNGYLIARGAEYDHDFYLGLELPAGVSGVSSVSFFEMGSLTVAAGYPKVAVFAGDTQLKLVENVASVYYDGNSTYVNTFADQAIVQGPRFEFELALDQPANFDVALQAPFDPFIFVHDTGYEIHTVDHAPRLATSDNVSSGHTQFRDINGYPFAMLLNEEWMPPLAGVDMGLAYPEFIEHVISEGNTKPGWFLNPDGKNIKAIPFQTWQW